MLTIHFLKLIGGNPGILSEETLADASADTSKDIPAAICRDK